MNNLLSYPDMEFKINEIPKGKLIAVDTETTGLNPYKGDKAFLFSFANIEGDISVVQYLPENKEMLDKFFLDESITKIFHNAKFDLKMIRACKFEVKGRIHDTLVMAHLADENENSHNLEKLTKKYIKDFDDIEAQQVKKWFTDNGITGKKKKRYYEIPEEILYPYAAVDAWNCMQLYLVYKEPIKDMLKMYRLDMRCLKYVIKMEDRGVLIDKVRAKELVKDLKPQYEIEQKKVKELTGMIIEPSDGRTIAAALFAAEEKCIEITGNKSAATGKKTLKKYKAKFISHLIKMIDLNKLITDISNQILPNTDKNGVLHTNFNISQARTGRFSSSQPNCQNIKKKNPIREIFICRPEYINFYFDYSQIEYRMYTFFSRDEVLLQGYRDGTCDMHDNTAQQLDVDRDEVAKTVNFAILFGSGAPGLSELLNISVDEARKIIEIFKAKNPSLEKLAGKLRRKLMLDGYLEDCFGKRYFLPIKDHRKCVNTITQGPSCNVLKYAMVENLEGLLEDTKSNLLMIIHDECVLEVHESELYLVPQIQAALEDIPMIDLPLPVGIKYTRTNWLEKKAYDPQMFLAESIPG